MTTYAYRKPVHFIETPHGVDIAIDHNAPGSLHPDPPRKVKPKKKLSKLQRQTRNIAIVKSDSLYIEAPLDPRARERFGRR